MKHLIKLLALFLLFSTCVLTAADKETIRFLSFTDIHFTPFSSCSISVHPCPLIKKLQNSPAKDWEKIFSKDGEQSLAKAYQESNYPLFKKTLQQLAILNAEDHPQFALMLGDWLAHKYRALFILYSHDRSEASYRAFVSKTIEFLTLEIHEALPNLLVIPVLGNNDSDKGNYHVDPNGNFLQKVENEWSIFFNNGQKNEFQTSFADSGYYEIQVSPNQKIIVLNTVLFSTKIKGQGTKSAAIGQMQWLDKQLQKAKDKQQKVLIAVHIPVGTNMYETAKTFFGKAIPFWQDSYTDSFKKILLKYPDTINAILAGHVHIDSASIVKFNPEVPIPISYTPSVSPNYGNQPSVRSYEISPEGKLSFETYYLN